MIEDMISIRRANPSDAVALSQIALSAKKHWGYPERWMELWKPELTFDAGYFEANESWTAELGGQPVAFYSLIDKEGMAWLENLWVRPEYMSRGIGRMLFHHALQLARRRGYGILQLEADPNAAGFYEKMGMHKISERKYKIDDQLRILPRMEMKL